MSVVLMEKDLRGYAAREIMRFLADIQHWI